MTDIEERIQKLSELQTVTFEVCNFVRASGWEHQDKVDKLSYLTGVAIGSALRVTEAEEKLIRLTKRIDDMEERI